MLIFRVLGPLEIETSTRIVRPTGSLQRTLLLTLLTSTQRLVSTGMLIDELWNGQHPDRVENALQAHVSRLRQKLASLEPDAATSRLIAHSSGYELVVGEGELDAEIFANALTDIRARQSGTPPAVTAEALQDALGLWRGPMFGAARGGPRCRAASARYEELRLGALESLIDCELQCGEHARTIPLLRDLLREHPFQERFSQQLMIALYRCGRQAEALDVYRALRFRLMDELGLEPSPRMRDYERAILEQDPMLGRPAQVHVAGPVSAAGPASGVGPVSAVEGKAQPAVRPGGVLSKNLLRTLGREPSIAG
ncbi:AfsR/SARP family transcriptional regulator [Frankia sp. Cpl3]|nr:AfsR/SARP family transcriptional regulator [Frankia sp. Cpl3]